MYHAFGVSGEVSHAGFGSDVVGIQRKIAHLIENQHLISKKTDRQNTSLPQKLIEPMSVRQMSTNCHLNRRRICNDLRAVARTVHPKSQFGQDEVTFI